MSITPLNPLGMPPLSPEPQSAGTESAIIRACKAIVFVALGFGLGFLMAIVIIGGQADADAQRTHELLRAQRAEVEKANDLLQAQQDERRRYATVLLEPNTAEQLVVGALGWVVGMPGAGEAILGGLPGGDRKWILQGKQKPMSAAPNTAYLWIDLETKQSEGPFQPEAVK